MNHRSRTLVVAILVVGLTFGSAGTALATVSQASGYTYVGHLRCAWGQVWIDNVPGQPKLTSVATMDAWDGVNLCGNTSAVAPANELAVRQDLIVYSWVWQRWMVCNSGPWQVNAAPSHEKWTSFSWASKPCPEGNWYVGTMQSAVVDQAGAWYGTRSSISTPNAIYLN